MNVGATLLRDATSDSSSRIGLNRAVRAPLATRYVGRSGR